MPSFEEDKKKQQAYLRNSCHPVLERSRLCMCSGMSPGCFHRSGHRAGLGSASIHLHLLVQWQQSLGSRQTPWGPPRWCVKWLLFTISTIHFSSSYIHTVCILLSNHITVFVYIGIVCICGCLHFYGLFKKMNVSTIVPKLPLHSFLSETGCVGCPRQ